MISMTEEQIEERLDELKELLEDIKKMKLDKEELIWMREEHSLEYDYTNYDELEIEEIKEDMVSSIEHEIENLELDLEIYY